MDDYFGRLHESDMRSLKYGELRRKHKLTTQWAISVYLVSDFNSVPFPGVKKVMKKSYEVDVDFTGPGKPVVTSNKMVPIVENLPDNSRTWLDIWRAIDRIVVQSKDFSHTLVRMVEIDPENADTVIVTLAT